MWWGQVHFQIQQKKQQWWVKFLQTCPNWIFICSLSQCYRFYCILLLLSADPFLDWDIPLLGTDYGSGQIPGLIFSRTDKENTQKEVKHVSNSTDTIPLGDWPSGLKHLLSIISMTFTALKSRIPSPQKIPMSLNLSSLTPPQVYTWYLIVITFINIKL